MAQILIYNRQNKCLLFSAFVLGDKMQSLGFGVFLIITFSVLTLSQL